MKEYVIWGIPPKQTEETLLLTSVQGNKITTRTKAEQYQLVLEKKMGATKTRIQELDLSEPLDWKKEIGI